ncbi:MAG: hypothetical protein J3K34DRAFT_435819 [Monoraphidium minutum]|nr:MAG: hypothetical protein J3K34DRAFT_435819 [Monoraphidium minutum]
MFEVEAAPRRAARALLPSAMLLAWLLKLRALFSSIQHRPALFTVAIASAPTRLCGPKCQTAAAYYAGHPLVPLLALLEKAIP